jgi:hypothetical protein
VPLEAGQQQWLGSGQGAPFEQTFPERALRRGHLEVCGRHRPAEHVEFVANGGLGVAGAAPLHVPRGQVVEGPRLQVLVAAPTLAERYTVRIANGQNAAYLK